MTDAKISHRKYTHICFHSLSVTGNIEANRHFNKPLLIFPSTARGYEPITWQTELVWWHVCRCTEMLLTWPTTMQTVANLSHWLLLLLLLLLPCHNHHILSHLHHLTATRFWQWLWTINHTVVTVPPHPYNSAGATEKCAQCEKPHSLNVLTGNLHICLLTHWQQAIQFNVVECYVTLSICTCKLSQIVVSVCY